MAVLSGNRDQSVSAVRKLIDVWQSLAPPGRSYTLSASTEDTSDGLFYSGRASRAFTLDLSKSEQSEWTRLLADLPSIAALRINSERAFTTPASFEQRIALHYLAPHKHPRLPDFAARLGHVAISVPANPASATAVVGFMEKLAAGSLVTQAYVATYNFEDEPQATLYELAADARGRRILRERSLVETTDPAEAERLVRLKTSRGTQPPSVDYQR